jgi:lipopolysaccharide assembly outer membrane protein LptD (OstA)
MPERQKRKTFFTFKRQSGDEEDTVMKKVIFGSFVLSLIVVAIAVSQGTQDANRKHAQVATPEGSNVNFVADNIQRQGQFMRLKGSVEMRTHDMSLRADEVTYDQKTGEMEATGMVRLKLATQN